ncbi:hypothetical protein ACENVV_002062 [Vibrio cholerae]|nr:hypothetical protein [Vibrio cholerae]
MIYYYALSSYQVLGCISHKLKYHDNDDAVILISDVNYYCKSISFGLKKCKVFKDVYVVNDNLAKSFLDRTLSLETLSKDDIVRKLANFKEKASQVYPVEFSSDNKYYIYLDHWPLGILLNLNNISYSFLEDGAGMFFRHQRALEMLRSTDIYIYNLAKKLDLIGRNSLVTEVYLDENSQPEVLESKINGCKYIHFNLEEIISEFPKTYIDLILSVFDAGECNISDNDKAALFLTQNFVNLNLLSMEEQRKLFSLIIDYFAEGYKLYIKPHPFDFHPDYREWFKEAVLIEKSVPSELVRFIVPRKFELGLTASSTGIHALSNILGESLSFDDNIHLTYSNMHRLFVTLSMVKHVSNNKVIVVTNNVKQVENFNKYLGFGLDIETSSSLDDINESFCGSLILDYISGDEKSLEKIRQFDHVDNIFVLNSDKSDISSFLKMSELGFSPFNQVIQVASLDKNRTINISVEDIFAMSRNQEALGKLLKFELEKYFSNSNEQIKVSYNISDQYLIERFNKALIRSLESRILEQQALIDKLESKGKCDV